MVWITNSKTGERKDVSASEARASGSEWTVDKGKVPVVGEGGFLTYVDAVDYVNNPQYTEMTEERSQEQEDYRKYGGFGSAVQTAAESAVSGATLGLSDVVASGIAPDYYAERKKREEYNPNAAMAGEVAGIVAPALLTGGGSILAKGGLAAGKSAVKAGVAGAERAAVRGALRTGAALTPAGATAVAGQAVERGLGAALGRSLLGKAAASGGGAATEGAIQAGALAFNKTLADGGSVDEAVEALLTSAKYGAVFGGAVGVAAPVAGALASRGARFLGKADEAVEGASKAAKVTKKGKKAAETAAETAEEVPEVPAPTEPPNFFNSLKSNEEIGAKLHPMQDSNALADDALDYLGSQKVIKATDSVDDISKKSGELIKKTEPKVQADIGVISTVSVPPKVHVSKLVDDLYTKIESLDDTLPKAELTELLDDFSDSVMKYMNAEKPLTYKELFEFRKGMDSKIASGALKNELSAYQIRNQYSDSILDLLGKEIENNPTLKQNIGERFFKNSKTLNNLEYINQVSLLNLDRVTKEGLEKLRDPLEASARAAGVPTTVGDIAKSIKDKALGKLGIPTSVSDLAQRAGVPTNISSLGQKVLETVGVPGSIYGVGSAMGMDSDTKKALSFAGMAAPLLLGGKGRIGLAIAARKMANPELGVKIGSILRETAIARGSKKISDSEYTKYIDKLNSKKSIVNSTLQDPNMPEITKAVLNKQLQIINYLQEQAPVGVGESLDPLQPNVNKMTPNSVELRAFSEKSQICENPLSILQELHQNTVTLNHVEALKTNYPYVYKTIQQEILEELKGYNKQIPRAKRYQLGILLEIPASYDLQNIGSMQAGFIPGQNPEKVQPIGNLPESQTQAPVFALK